MAKTVKKTVRKKRRERKNIEKGQAHIQSTFNNTLVTLTDMQGKRAFMVKRRFPWIQRIQKIHSVCCSDGRRRSCQRRYGARTENR